MSRLDQILCQSKEKDISVAMSAVWLESRWASKKAKMGEKRKIAATHDTNLINQENN